MLSPFEIQQVLDQQARERAFKARAAAQAQPLTPAHSEAIAANEYAGDVAENADAQRRRSRVQHEADPYLAGDDVREMDEAALADLGKRFRDAADMPSGYPVMGPVSAEQFRDGPITADHASYGAAYARPAYPVPVPSAAVSAAAITRPLLTDGRSRPGAGG